MVCRTGYTGERGYELIAAQRRSPATLWDALLAAGEQHGLLACGLGARDTLRTEMGYPLHGQDISPRRHPQPGPPRLGGRLEEGAFWGRDVLLAEKEAGPKRLLRGLRRHRPGHPATGHDASA